MVARKKKRPLRTVTPRAQSDNVRTLDEPTYKASRARSKAFEGLRCCRTPDEDAIPDIGDDFFYIA